MMSVVSSLLQHMKVWGPAREGMSVMSSIAKIALVDDETLMLVSRGAMANSSLPPGFIRFLTEVEIADRGLQSYIPELAMRVGRKWNSAQPVYQRRPAPYYRQFDKRKFRGQRP